MFFCILTCLPGFVVVGRWHVHAAVHPIRFTSMEMALCVILLVGATHRGPDILKEPLAKITGPALSGSGVGLSGILLARGLLGVHLILEVGCQSNTLGLVIWDRLIPQDCMLVISVEGREIDNALRHIERQRPLNPLIPLCLDIIQKIRSADID